MKKICTIRIHIINEYYRNSSHFIRSLVLVLTNIVKYNVLEVHKKKKNKKVTTVNHMKNDYL